MQETSPNSAKGYGCIAKTTDFIEKKASDPTL